MSNQSYIHIGVPKAASRTLQENLFCHLPSFNYIGRPGVRTDKELRFITQVISNRENFEYNEMYKQFISLINKRVFVRGKKTFFSAEALSVGSSLDGRVDRTEIARRFAKLLPGAKILLVIRNQFDVIRSRYAQLLKNDPRYMPWRRWLANEREKTAICSWLTRYRYDAIYRIYSRFFGKGNITVLLFEDLTTGETACFKQLKSFLDTSLSVEKIKKMVMSQHANKRFTVMQNTLKRMGSIPVFNKMKPVIPASIKSAMIHLSAELGRRAAYPYSEDDKTFFHEFFRPYNTTMSKILNRDLIELGYPGQGK